jgi:hypothetical protein
VSLVTFDAFGAQGGARKAVWAAKRTHPSRSRSGFGPTGVALKSGVRAGNGQGHHHQSAADLLGQFAVTDSDADLIQSGGADANAGRDRIWQGVG